MDDKPRTEAEHESVEDEGIPELERPHPAKIATGDPQEGLMVPRDEPRGAEDWGTTAEEQMEGRPLADRLDAELPDTEEGQREQAGRLREEGFGLVDTEKDLVADEAEDDVDGLSAEEAAMRIEDPPPGVSTGPDTYLDDPSPEPDRSEG